MRADGAKVGWGILGTAGIAVSSFLPALTEAGGGRALVVGGRHGRRAARWAEEVGVARAVEGYRAVLDDPEVEALYIPLPNAMHAEWTIAALAAGKTVFCEKPLCGTVEETERVLAAARTAPGYLWEAFVFPFHEQMRRARTLIADGAIGELREIWSRFHFMLDDPDDIRLSPNLAGGATQDVGSYTIRLARLLFDAEPDLSLAAAHGAWSGGVDVELWGMLAFPGDRRLLLSCGFRSDYDSLTRVIGTSGEIRMTNPFHPEPGDSCNVFRDGQIASEEPAAPDGERSFTAAIRHIHRVLRGSEEPVHLAIDEGLGERASDRLAAGRGRRMSSGPVR